ncbi:MAG: hypothetical protein HY898_29950 [Deltaproteobacteria bacterium]|nr:hypothetical protein [Deltaproteobacteria bacterium]
MSLSPSVAGIERSTTVFGGGGAAGTADADEDALATTGEGVGDAAGRAMATGCCCAGGGAAAGAHDSAEYQAITLLLAIFAQSAASEPTALGNE